MYSADQLFPMEISVKGQVVESHAEGGMLVKEFIII